MQAVFVRGEDVLMVNHTPDADIDAGQVVVLEDTLLIAHRPILEDELGALAISGGTYKVTGDAAIDAGKTVYWDDTTNKVTEAASGNLKFGKAAEACSGNNAIFECVHEPTN